MQFSRPTRLVDWAVALHVIALAMIGFGIAGLVKSQHAAPGKEADVIALEHLALECIGLGVGLICLFWLVRWWIR